MFKNSEILKELVSMNKKLDKLILCERGGRLKDLSFKKELNEVFDLFAANLSLLMSQIVALTKEADNV